MKSGVLLIILLLLGALMTGAQETTTLTYATRVIESFDDPEAQLWIVQGSKFATEGYPQMEYAKIWPQQLFGRNWENVDLRCIGIYCKFDREGFNYIEFIPVREDQNGNYVSDPLTIPGRAKYLDLWVWGSNYDYYMEVHLVDFRGMNHVLPLGSLNFEGWQSMSVNIPTSIPQVDHHLPKYKNIELTKLVLWTRPEEKVDGFYVYIDHIKVLTDLYQQRFDGDDLVDSRTVEQIWGSEIAEEE